MRRLSYAALAAMATCASFAQSVGSAAPLFIERPGDMEFTGRMIARPKQIGVMLAAGMSAAEAQARRSQARGYVTPMTKWHVPETDEYVIAVPFGQSETMVAQRLMATGSFQYVEPDWRVYPIATPNDPSFGSQWHLPKINAPGAWDHFSGTGAVVIAITDTGVRLDHQDLISQLVPGANSASGTAIPQASGGQVNDLNGHGTHTAGTAGARGNNALGVSGVNWDAKIMPIRVSDSSGGSSSITALTAGARWAADNGARVVSTSYSGVSNAAVQTTGNYIKFTRNGVYCWAAGNSNATISADHPDVTIVGATTSSDGKASFSNFGIGLDVYAPGVDILATYFSSSTSYALMSGTSMACPNAAGLAGLIIGANPALTAQEVETILYETCLDLTAAPGGVGNDGYWGWGRIDALAALRRVYNTKAFGPTGMTVVNGVLQAGTVTQLGSGDDQYVALGYAVPTASPYPISIEIQGTSTNKQIARMDFVVESAASAATIGQNVELFDFAANQWVSVGNQNLTTTDQTFTITPTSPNRFRNSATGQMRARVNFASLIREGARSFTARIDRVSWLTTAQ